MIMGNVVSGKNTGRKFLSKKEYKELIKKKFGFEPFEGTLNIKTNPKNKLKFLDSLKKFKIEGFEVNNGEFGGISCFKARLNGVEGAIVIPDKTEHPEEILEFISESNLRQRLNLKDGSEVMILKNE